MNADAVAPRADAAEIARLEEMARRIRVHVVKSVNHARGGHLGGPLSAADLLSALYFHVMRIRPEDPAWPDRDRFVLSKGHSSIGLYAAMALRGYFPEEELLTSTPPTHGSRPPDMTRLPGLDISTGRSAWAYRRDGIALGGRLTGRDIRAFVMPRRRRVPGGRGSGRPLWRPRSTARQPHRDHRPQPAPADRLARGRTRRPAATPGPRRARRQVEGLRLAGAGGGRPRHGGHRRRPRAGDRR